jgi:hypothetical protein
LIKIKKEALMTFLMFIALLVIAALAIGLVRELASYSSNNRSGISSQKVPIAVAKATSVRRYFRRQL